LFDLQGRKQRKKKGEAKNFIRQDQRKGRGRSVKKATARSTTRMGESGCMAERRVELGAGVERTGHSNHSGGEGRRRRGEGVRYKRAKKVSIQ
jgi:hypothetical protein